VTREFQANPNLHKNPQVELVGDYSTGGSSSVQFQWSWKWTPPKATESRGGGWRTSCSVGTLFSAIHAFTDSVKFVEYDQRAHKLETLANFAFWVQSRYFSYSKWYAADNNRHCATQSQPAIPVSTAGPQCASPLARPLLTIDRLTSQRLG
jgi:hypothetical protein